MKLIKCNGIKQAMRQKERETVLVVGKPGRFIVYRCLCQWRIIMLLSESISYLRLIVALDP